MEPILGPGPPLPPPFSLLLLLGLFVIGVWSLLPGDRRRELFSAKSNETLRQQKVPGNPKLTKVPPPHWEDNLQMGCTGADLACFSGLPVGWAQNYTLWSMDRSLQHIFKHLETARSSLMNLSLSSQGASTSSSSSSTTAPQDLQTLTHYECHSPESSRVQRTSSLHTNFSATQSLAYVFRERLQHRSCSLPNPSKNYSGQARVRSLPPFLLSQAKKNTIGKKIFLDNSNSIQRPCETKAVEEENDSWVPKEIRNSLELHIRRKIAQRVARPPLFRAIKLSISPYPLVYSPIREKTTKKRRGNKVLKVPNSPSTNLRDRPRLPCWAPIQLSHAARGVLEGHMAWKVCTLRSQRVPTAVKQSWAMLNCIIEVQNEGHKPQSSAKGTNKKPPDVSCCLLPMALETDQKRPTTPKSIQVERQLQPRPPLVTQDAFCSGVDVILGEATFLPEDVKKRLELCIKKNVNCLLKKAMERQKENEKLSTGLQLQVVGTVKLLPTVESVPLGPRPQVQVKDSKRLTPESHGQVTDSLGLNSGPQVQEPQIQDTDEVELTPVPQKQDIDSLELKGSSSKVQDLDSVATTPVPEKHDADFAVLTSGSPVQDVDSMGPTPGLQIKSVFSGGLSLGSQVKLTDSKELAQESQVKLTDPKGLAQGSQVKLTDSKGLISESQVKLTDSKELAQGSQVKLTDSKELAQGSQVKLTDSKELAQGSQVKFTDSKELTPGSQVKLTDSKGLAQRSQVKLTDSKGLISGSQVRLTDSKGLAQGSQVRLTDSKELAQRSQVKLTDSKGLISGSQVRLTDSKGLAQGSQVRLTDSKELAQGSQIKLTDSKGLAQGSQVKLTDSKELAQGSQVRLTDSKELAQGSQVRSIDSKGLISGSQIRLTESKGLSQGSEVQLTDSKGLVQGSQVKSADSKGLTQRSQIKFKDSKGLTLKPHAQVMDSVEVTPGPRIQVIDPLGVTSTSKFQLIDPKQLTLKLQSPIEDSFHLIQSSIPLHILGSSRIVAKPKQGLHGSKTQEILRSALGDLNKNIVIQKPFILRMSSKFSKTEQPSTPPRPLSVQPSHSLRQRRLSPQCLFQAPSFPPWKSKNSFCQERSRIQVKAQEQRISKGRVARRKSSSTTSMLRKNLWAKMQQAPLPVQEAHGQRLPPVSYPYAANEHFFPPRQMMVSQYCQGKIMGTPPRTSLSQRDTICQLCRKYLPFNEELENSRPSTSQDYPNVTTKEAQGSSEPMERRKEREQVSSELSELPQSTSPQLPSSHKVPSSEENPASVEQNEKPDGRSQIRTSESQPRPLSVTSSHEQTQLLRDLQLKIAQKLLKKQLSPNFTPSLTTDMVLQYPICLQCGRCSGPGCPHKFHDSVGPWLLIYPRLRLFRNSEGRAEFRVHLGFRLRTRNQTQTPKQQASQSDPSEKRKDKVCTDHVTKKNFTLSSYPKTDIRPKPFQTTEPSQNPRPIQVHVKRNLPGRRVEVVKALSEESEQDDFTIHSFLDTDSEGGWARGEAKRILYSEQMKTPKDIRTMTQKTERVPRQRIPPKDREIHPKRRTKEAQKVAPLSRHSEKSTGFMQWLCLKIKRTLGMAYPPRPSSQQMHDPRARQQGSVFPEQAHIQHGSKYEGKQWIKSVNATSLDTKMERKKSEIDGKKTEVFRSLGRVPKSITINQSKSFLKSTPNSRPSHRSISPVSKSNKIPPPRRSPVLQSHKISHSIPSHQYTSPGQRKCCSESVKKSNKTKQTSQGHKVILGGPVSKRKIPQQDAQGDRTGYSTGLPFSATPSPHLHDP